MGAMRTAFLVVPSFGAGLVLATLVPQAAEPVQRLLSLAGLTPGAGGEGAAQPQDEQPPPASVVLARAGREDVPLTVSTIGDTVASETVVLTPRAAGIVQAVGFQGGETVEAGALLVQLDPAEVRGELAVAEAELAELQGAAQRAQELASRGTGPQAVAEDLANRARAAEAAVASARERLSSFEVRAPFAGRLGLRTISVGALAQPGDEIVQLDAVDPIDVRFSVPERFLAQLAAGADVEATSAAYADELFQGEVTVVEPSVDPVLRTVRVLASFPNPDGRLVPGKLMAVDVRLGIDEDAVVLPAVAVRTEGSVQFVFREAQGAAERVEVRTGQRLADRIVIESGVLQGDRIVVEGLIELADGDPIAEADPHELSEALSAAGGS